MIKYIVELTAGFRRRIAVCAAVGIVRIVTGFVFVALSKHAVDIATSRAEGSLVLCVGALVAALVIELICSFVANRVAELSEGAMKNVLQGRFFSRLLTSEWTGREALHSGDMLSRLTEDCRLVAEALCRTVPTMLVAVFQLIGAFIFLCYFSPLLAIVLLLLLPMFIFAGKMFYKRVRILTHRIRGIESRLQENMQESLQHRVLLMACKQTERVIASIGSLHRLRYSLMRRRANITTCSRTAVLAGFESGYLIAFIWGIAGLRNGTVSFGLMTAYLQLAGQIQRPIAELARLMPGLIQSHAAFARLAEIDKFKNETESGDMPLSDSATPIGIEFRNVTFEYPGKHHPVLENFNHTFAPGSRTAIMGETGVGKSTLLRLILALLKPQSGEIFLFREDGGERQQVSAATRSEIVYVPQGNSLLSGTIRRNLRIGKPDATDREMWEALHCAAADFVAHLKYGLDTPCGEHGDGLSEGQAQRIAIARGLLSPGSILLLDEVSAALDEETERLLMHRLMEECGSRTVLFVTHRAGALPYCDDRLVID